MPLRFPPNQPEPPERGATHAQVLRYHSAIQAYAIGVALREYAKTLHATSRHDIPDDVTILPSPRYDAPSMGRRLAANGAPVSMEDICAHIDREARTVAPVARGFQQLRSELPDIAHVVWLRHVNLWTIDEIATANGISKRTTLRYLRIAHLRLKAHMDFASGAKVTGRKNFYRAEHAEAQFYHDTQAGDLVGDPTPQELAESGVVVTDKPKKRGRRPRFR